MFKQEEVLPENLDRVKAVAKIDKQIDLLKIRYADMVLAEAEAEELEKIKGHIEKWKEFKGLVYVLYSEE